MSDKEEIYRSAVNEYRFTIENQLEAHRRIKKWTVDVVRIDLLAISAILAGVSFSELDMTLLFLSSILCFLYALWAAAKVVHPSSLTRGVDHEFHNEVEKAVEQTEMKGWEHYRNLSQTYSECVKKYPNDHYKNKEDYLDSLWASICGILFITAYVLTVAASFTLPLSAEMPLLIIIPMIALWGRDINSGDDS